MNKISCPLPTSHNTTLTHVSRAEQVTSLVNRKICGACVILRRFVVGWLGNLGNYIFNYMLFKPLTLWPAIR